MTGVAEPLDDLRIALGEVNILATVTADAYDSEDWDQSDPDIADGIASLLGLIKKSAATAMVAFHRLHGAVADAQPARSGEAFDYSDGTAPGEGGEPAMSATDAAIIRQLRERSPDGRFADYSDAKLLRLFLRNRAAMGWNEEQVVDVMTRRE